MTARACAVCFAAALTTGLVAACGASHTNSPEEDTGQAVAAISAVPAQIACVEIDVAGARNVVTRVDVTAGQMVTASLTGLPLGSDTFLGLAYPSACNAVTSATQATWISNPVPVTLARQVVASIDLTLHPNGQAKVGVGFQDDDAGPPPLCLDWPAWPMPNDQSGAPHTQSYVISAGGGSVIDQVTGLEWQRGFSPQLHDTTADGGTSNEWAAASAYCASLTLEGKTWRLPNALELLSIADDSHANPAIDSNAFPGTQSAYYLASSPHGVPGWYSLVSFDFGYLQYVSGSTRVDYARCVVDTGATCSDSPPRYSVQSGVVVDGRSGLHWQQGDDPAKETFAGAATYCSSLVLGTGTWRVPTFREFMTLVDSRTFSFDPVAFPTNSGMYWTADPFFGIANEGWHASANGESNGSMATAQLAVKCVQ